ncbi:MAG: acyl carrier protein [Nitrospirota bacterium]
MRLSEQEIFEKLKKILIDKFEIKEDKITLDAHLYRDLGLDSIDAVDLAIRVQDLTGKRIERDDFHDVRTVGDIVKAAHALFNE